MATVWLGEDTLLARRIAIKTLHQELAAEPTVRTRFRNEAISSASIEDPGIVAIYDAGDDDGVVYIVMEYVEGRDLRRLLDERGTLPVSAASHIAERVALALDQAHGHGIVHRDVKPANVLVADDGRVKVTDFGIAKAASLRDGPDVDGDGARHRPVPRTRAGPRRSHRRPRRRLRHGAAALRDAHRPPAVQRRHRHGDRARRASPSRRRRCRRASRGASPRSSSAAWPTTRRTASPPRRPSRRPRERRGG